jgi:hypothetical protein
LYICGKERSASHFVDSKNIISQIEICFVEEKFATIEIQLCCGHSFGVMQESLANANCTQKIANLHS